jgi:hypothetical protein
VWETEMISTMAVCTADCGGGGSRERPSQCLSDDGLRGERQGQRFGCAGPGAGSDTARLIRRLQLSRCAARRRNHTLLPHSHQYLGIYHSFDDRKKFQTIYTCSRSLAFKPSSHSFMTGSTTSYVSSATSSKILNDYVRATYPFGHRVLGLPSKNYA